MRQFTLSCTALLGLTVASSAQVHVFDVDMVASAFTWDVTTSLGTLVGVPDNNFNLSGTIDMNLVGTQPTTAAEFLQSDVLVVPDLSGIIPNILPILPPLATVDVTNLRLSVSSMNFPVTAGAFMTDVTLVALSGNVAATPLGSMTTNLDLTGATSLPTPSSGTLTRVGNTITLNMPLNTSFPINIMTTTPPVTGNLTLNGTVVATTTAIDGFPTLCNGDGGDQMGCTDCPCMNNAPPGTVGGCLNSAGTSARLEATGDTSVSLPSGSTTDLRFALTGAPPTAFCILNSGDNIAPQNMANPCFGLNSGAQSVSFDGNRCAVQNTQRHGGRSADANGDVGFTNNPWGGEGGPPAGLAVAFGGFSAGQTRYWQVINREDIALGCMRGLNTSQAVEATFTP